MTAKPKVIRSPKWPSLRKQWLQDHPTCSTCGLKQKLEVHHIKPVHLFPEFELDTTNLITLCESPRICHFCFGHFWDWWKYNPTIVLDAPKRLYEVLNALGGR